ncbi:MAG: helix-turn-helix transcriptional regulator [Cyclobacteriaceae bacterium]|nr:helix-turn-helix transcriptional regulator [Cyclobacteriaceae bacterium]
MKKPKIQMVVNKEDLGYSALYDKGDVFIATQADTFEELKKNVLEAVNLSFEEEGLVYANDEIAFSYDLESFFDFYKVINAKALSERIGMNQSLLAQYIRGIKKPSPKQTKRILKGVQQIGKELTEAEFIV